MPVEDNRLLDHTRPRCPRRPPERSLPDCIHAPSAHILGAREGAGAESTAAALDLGVDFGLCQRDIEGYLAMVLDAAQAGRPAKAARCYRPPTGSGA